ncbi:Msx2-interacting protein [Bagarius yarrelli]|uniref:Msx2-interacting protein n=1 Tax=Bagarius yarrelli TaxID=175774 RepID=A0A556VVA6_BAGYA|nr:Msx2-interacting protein [Bagarius yarrelli]
MVLPTGLPAMYQYVASGHHSETVCDHASIVHMAALAECHLTAWVRPFPWATNQGDVRVKHASLSVMKYGIHSEGRASSWAPGQQRPSLFQVWGTRGGRNGFKVKPSQCKRVMKRAGGGDSKTLHQALGRPQQLSLNQRLYRQNTVARFTAVCHFLTCQTRGSGRLIYHPQGSVNLPKHHQGHITDLSTHLNSDQHYASLSPRAHRLQKGTVPPFQSIRTCIPNLRTVHSQFPDSSPIGISQPPRNIIHHRQVQTRTKRFIGESEFCLLLAMPCGVNQEDVVTQTQVLKSAFINYLKAKLAAGIINVPNPGSNQGGQFMPAYVLQIFPPCEFSESHLSRLAPDLINQISSISPHLMIVITSV